MMTSPETEQLDLPFDEETQSTSPTPPAETPKEQPSLSKLTATCGIDYDIGHYPFFIVAKKASGIRRVHFKGGCWEFHCGDFPTYNDLDVLLGTVRLFEQEEKLGNVKDAGTIAGRNARSVNISGRTMCKYVGVAPSGTNIRAIETAMKRLTSLTAYKHLDAVKHKNINKPACMQTIKFMLFFDWVQKENGQKILSIVIDEQFLKTCQKRNFRIRFQVIQKLKGQVAKGCLFFIECNNNRQQIWLPERRLFRFLGLDYPSRPDVKDKSKVAEAKEMKKFKQLLKVYNKKARDLRHDIKIEMDKLAADELIYRWALRKRGKPGKEVYLYAIWKTNFYVKNKTVSDSERKPG